VDRNRGDELGAILDQWRGRPVAVRVVAAGDELVAVFAGTLGRRSGAKGSSFFWPVDTGASAETTLEELRLRAGGFVVEFAQAGTTVNVRQLAHRAIS
jgi:hypothetical protein